MSLSSGAHAVVLSEENDLISTMIAAPEDYSSSEKVSGLFASIFERSSMTQNILEVRQREALEVSAANWVPEPEDNIFLQVILNNYDKLSSDSEREAFARANPAIDFGTRLPKPLASQKTQQLYGINLNDVNQDDYTRLRKFFVALRKSNPKFKFSDAQIHEFVMNILMKQKQGEDSSINELVAELMNDINALNGSTELAQKDEALKEISNRLSSLQQSLGGEDSSASALAQFLNSAHGATNDPSTLSALHADSGSTTEEEPLSALAGLDFESPESAFSGLALQGLPEFQSEAPMDWGLSQGGGQLQAAVDSAIQDDSDPRANLRRFTGTGFAPDSRSSDAGSESANAAPSLFNRETPTTVAPTTGTSAHQGRDTSTGSGHLSNGGTLHDDKDSHAQRQTVSGTQNPPSITPAPLAMSSRNFTQPGTTTNPTPANSGSTSTATPSWAIQEARNMADFLNIDKNSPDYQRYVDNYAKSTHQLYLAREAAKTNPTGGGGGGTSSNDVVSSPSSGAPAAEWSCKEKLENIFLAKFLNKCEGPCTLADMEAAAVQAEVAESLGFTQPFEQLTDNDKNKIRTEVLNITSNNPDICGIIKAHEEKKADLEKLYGKDSPLYKNLSGEMLTKDILAVGEASLTAIRAKHGAKSIKQNVAETSSSESPDHSSAEPEVARSEAPNLGSPRHDAAGMRPATQDSVTKPDGAKEAPLAQQTLPARDECSQPGDKHSFLTNVVPAYTQWIQDHTPSSRNWIQNSLKSSMSTQLNRLPTDGRYNRETLTKEIATTNTNNPSETDVVKTENAFKSMIIEANFEKVETLYREAKMPLPSCFPDPLTNREGFIMLAESLHLVSIESFYDTGMMRRDPNNCPSSSALGQGSAFAFGFSPEASIFSTLAQIHSLSTPGVFENSQKNKMSCREFASNILPKANFPMINLDRAPLTRLLKNPACSKFVESTYTSNKNNFPSDATDAALTQTDNESSSSFRIRCIGALSTEKYYQQVLNPTQRSEPSSSAAQPLAQSHKDQSKN